MVARRRPRRRPSAKVARTTTTATVTPTAMAMPRTFAISVSTPPFRVAELRLDVGLGDRFAGRHRHTGWISRRFLRRVPIFQVSAPPTSSTAVMMAYGAQDQLPEKVDPVSVCSAPEPADGHADDPEAEQQRTGQAERDDAHELLERGERLLLEVGDDELPELGDDLGQRRRSVGHVWIQLGTAPCRQAQVTMSPGSQVAGTSASAVGAFGYCAITWAICSRFALPVPSEKLPFSSRENSSGSFTSTNPARPGDAVERAGLRDELALRAACRSRSSRACRAPPRPTCPCGSTRTSAGLISPSVASSSEHGRAVVTRQPRAVDHVQPGGRQAERLELVADDGQAVRGRTLLARVRRDLAREQLAGEVVARREEPGEDVGQRRRLQRRDRGRVLGCLAVPDRADVDARAPRAGGRAGPRRSARAPGPRHRSRPGPWKPSLTVSAPSGPISRSVR